MAQLIQYPFPGPLFFIFYCLASWSHHGRLNLSHSVCASPLLRCLDSSGLILFPTLSNVVGEWVIGVRGTEKGLDGEEDGADLQGGGPVV